MTVILSQCVFCGDVSLRPDEVSIVIYGTVRKVEFDCPVCETPVDRDCNDRVREVLLAVGVTEIPGVPIPDSIVGMLRDLRGSSERIISSFQCQMDSVSTPADMGFVS